MTKPGARPLRLPRFAAVLFLLALGAVTAQGGCGKDSPTQSSVPLALSASSRALSLREDSLRTATDSVAVVLSGTGASSTHWAATHGGGSWLTLTSATGTGSGMLRWSRDAAALTSGTYVDTITVALQVAGGATARIVDSVTVRDAPAQYIAVRRAWRAGERDSVAAYIVSSRALDEFSDIAAQAVLLEDSTVDVVLNPAWHPAGAAHAGGPVQPAPMFQAGWSALGLDILVVFDSFPDNPVIPASLGIQRDSLDWISVRWWNPADQTWKGWAIRGTTASTWSAYQTINTAAFDASGGRSGLGAGEARLASGTYWEADGGRYRLTSNGGYGAFSQITSGPYLGGDVAVGTMGGRLNNLTMPRLLGTDTPTTEVFTFDFAAATIPAWRIRCYFSPVPPVSPFHQCTGAAAAALVKAAREHRLTARTAAGLEDAAFPLLLPLSRRQRTGGRRHRRLFRSGFCGRAGQTPRGGP